MKCTAVITQNNKLWLGWLEEIPVYTDADTREELLVKLKSIGKEFLTSGQSQAGSNIENEFEEVMLTI